jgi:hypothetical protein
LSKKFADSNATFIITAASHHIAGSQGVSYSAVGPTVGTLLSAGVWLSVGD